MNALHKSLNLSRFAPVCVCPVIYGFAAPFKGGGGRNATWNISLRDNLAKQNNANKQENGGRKKGSSLKKRFSPFRQTCRQYFCRRWSFLIISARNNTGITDAGLLLLPGLLNCGEKRQTFHHFSTDAVIPFFYMTENEGLLKEKWVFFIWIKSTKMKPQSAGSL